jgi:hypothetical protein
VQTEHLTDLPLSPILSLATRNTVSQLGQVSNICYVRSIQVSHYIQVWRVIQFC